MADLHREDIKALIRKNFGSLRTFERQKGLPDKSVSAVLRGFASRRVQEAIEGLIRASTGIPSGGDASEHSREAAGSHQINQKAA